MAASGEGFEPMKTAKSYQHNNRLADARLQGIAAACAVLARDHGEPDDAAMVLDSLGLTIADLETAGADAYDLEALRRQR
jgi:hypothetical protein